MTRDDLSPIAIACIERARDGFPMPRSSVTFRDRIVITGLLANEPPLIRIDATDAGEEIVRATDAGLAAIAPPRRSLWARLTAWARG